MKILALILAAHLLAFDLCGQTKYVWRKDGSSLDGLNDPVLSSGSTSEFDGYSGPVPNTPGDNWYAACLTIGNGERGVQIAHGYPYFDDLYFRGGTNGWHSWRKILNEANYASFALPLKGGSLSGSLAIGTTNNHGYKLAVNGNILAQKIRVSQSDWPDYVFRPAYRLIALSELEKYIQTEKHLPEIPSASEVDSSGIDIGDNQALLLKKIEELTLYIIEQDKSIRNQQIQIELQKEEILELSKLRAEVEALKQVLAVSR